MWSSTPAASRRPNGRGDIGDAPRTFFRLPKIVNSNISAFKNFTVGGKRLQFRWESFNFTNTPQFSAPNATLGSATFGRITSTLINNREMQLALKYIF